VRERFPLLFGAPSRAHQTWGCKSPLHPAKGSVRWTARVSIARWNLEEAVQGGPLSPPLSNILLDDLNHALQRRRAELVPLCG
jgi:hypothetical protein